MSKIEWEENFKHKNVHDNQELFKNALLDAKKKNQNKKKTALQSRKVSIAEKKILLKREVKIVTNTLKIK